MNSASPLIIMFPPGLGGNHLANVISLSGQYEFEVNFDKYFNESNHAHFNNHGKPKDSDISIFLNHFGSADDDDIERLVAEYNCIFLVIGMPNSNDSVACHRFLSYNNLVEPVHIIEDIKKIYKSNFLSKIYTGRWETVLSDDMFDISKAEAFINELEEKLEITFPNKEFAVTIHKKWIEQRQREFRNQDIK